MKTWNLRKKKEAVSPVIATILMVAITVVLAAVLYVMVMGFGGDTTSAPTGAFGTPATTSGATFEEKITIISIEDAPSYADIKVSVIVASVAYTKTIASGVNTFNPVIPTTSITSVTFVDITGDSKVSEGDYFLVVAAAAGTPISINLLWGDDNEQIATASWTSA
jgi:flagellin-like protein